MPSALKVSAEYVSEVSGAFHTAVGQTVESGGHGADLLLIIPGEEQCHWLGNNRTLL